MLDQQLGHTTRRLDPMQSCERCMIADAGSFYT